MARQASSKPDSGSSSTANIGFEADSHSFEIRHSAFVISSALPSQFFYSTQIRAKELTSSSFHYCNE